ncbi:hypothetical protein ACRQ5Q_14720 [Bradyrhizobium sp. PMVTL-01]|uniref:hypothetical protein n=1 Tax=Bradyrhizobium sp. PMVTL-01 TaxID=3434999 RepID=UPI003F72A368
MEKFVVILLNSSDGELDRLELECTEEQLGARIGHWLEEITLSAGDTIRIEGAAP